MMKRAAGGRVVWFPFATCLQVDVVYIYIYIYIFVNVVEKNEKQTKKFDRVDHVRTPIKYMYSSWTHDILTLSSPQFSL
jgi:hypothetical protein